MPTFFSIDGRTPRLRFLIVSTIAAVVLLLLGRSSWDERLAIALPAGAVAGLVLAKVAAEAGRRLHDTGASARAGAWAALLLGLMALGSLYLSLNHENAMLPVTGLVGVALLFLVVRPGVAGANRFGVPPDGPVAATTTGAAHAAWLLPTVCVVAAVGLVLALASLNDALRRTQEDQYRLSRQPRPGSDENIFVDPVEGNKR